MATGRCSDGYDNDCDSATDQDDPGCPAVVVVTTTSDVIDGTTTSIAALLADPGPDGEISLREAVEATNATANGAGADEIHFSIDEPLVDGTHTISYNPGPFPNIVDPVVINGQTEPDFAGTPIVELDGSNAGFEDGVHLAAGSDGSVVRGLVINGYSGSGVEIHSNGNTVADCYLGTDVTGSIPRGNLEGVIVGGDGNLIIGNIIGGSTEEGIDTMDGSGTIIQDNYIGTNQSNADLGNDYGVLLWRGHTGALVGGIQAGEGNVIAHNRYTGVAVYDGVVGHSILQNSIYGNSSAQIDLGLDGVTVNDAGDSDSGDNNLQNYPLLTFALTDQAGNVAITGSLNSTAFTAFRIEFFASSNSGRQADRFLGAVDVTTDAVGDAVFSPDLAALVFAGEYITATATVNLGGGDFGDTSELAATVVAWSP